MNIKYRIATLLPFLGFYKRFFRAAYDSVVPSRTYSQHGEDETIYELLSKNGLLNGIYVDVGANHPTSISNTYLFYKRGHRGLTIEPNAELARLHRWFRPKDRVIEAGISDHEGILEFNISKTPVLSSFKRIEGEGLWKTVRVPVFTLDKVIDFAKPERIFLLSIDTEGLNHQVIRGAPKALNITDFVCIEVDDVEDDALITRHLTVVHDFRRIMKLGCNVLFAKNMIADKLLNI